MPFFKRNSSIKEKEEKKNPKKQQSSDQLSSSLTENLERIKQKTGNSPDITIRHIQSQ